MESGMARTKVEEAPARKTRAAVKAPAAKAAAKAAAKPAAKSAVKPPAKPAARTKAAASPGKAAKDAARKLAAPAKGRARAAAAPVERAEAARATLVRDSFTMPEQEYAVLGAVKQACLKAGFEVKKSELLRIGVALLGQLDTASLRAVLASLPQLKTGRPPGE
jgi:Tfp pilus assembly protein FimV